MSDERKKGAQRLDHVGIAVHSLEDALKAYTGGLSLEVGGREVVASEQVRVAFLPVGETSLEFLEPTDPESAIGRFLKRKGEGIHHLCFQVPDLAAALEDCRRAGVRLVDESPRPGAGGHKVAFIHPRSMSGVLIELVEKKENT